MLTLTHFHRYALPAETSIFERNSNLFWASNPCLIFLNNRVLQVVREDVVERVVATAFHIDPEAEVGAAVSFTFRSHYLFSLHGLCGLSVMLARCWAGRVSSRAPTATCSTWRWPPTCSWPPTPSNPTPAKRQRARGRASRSR